MSTSQSAVFKLLYEKPQISRTQEPDVLSKVKMFLMQKQEDTWNIENEEIEENEENEENQENGEIEEIMENEENMENEEMEGIEED